MQATETNKNYFIAPGLKIMHEVDEYRKMEMILDYISMEKRISVAVLKSRPRDRTYTDARQLFYFLARRFTKCILSEIGEFVGGRNHATVLHGANKVQNFIDRDQIKSVENTIEEMKKFYDYVDFDVIIKGEFSPQNISYFRE